MKTFLQVWMLILLLGNVGRMQAQTNSDSWDGSTTTEITPESDVYKVNTVAELAWIANQVNEGSNDFKGKTISLTTSLDMGENQWTPIGTTENRFRGIFDGGGNEITYKSPETAALFGYVESGTIKDLTVNRTIETKSKLLFSLLVSSMHGGVIENVITNGELKVGEGATVGGVAGEVQPLKDETQGKITSTIIKDCQNNADLISEGGSSEFGGMVGMLAQARNGQSGEIVNVCQIINCTNTGHIKADNCVGGMVGNAAEGCFLGCKNQGTIELTGDSESNTNAGGIVGQSLLYGNSTKLSFIDCVNTGDVSPGYQVGGISGLLLLFGGGTSQEVLFLNCMNEGRITGKEYVGGIIANAGILYAGYDPPTNSKCSIVNSMNTGTVSGETYVGGIAGVNDVYGDKNNESTIYNCFNNATVTASANDAIVAGIAAFEGSGGIEIIEHCYSYSEGNTNLPVTTEPASDKQNSQSKENKTLVQDDITSGNVNTWLNEGAKKYNENPLSDDFLAFGWKIASNGEAVFAPFSPVISSTDVTIENGTGRFDGERITVSISTEEKDVEIYYATDDAITDVSNFTKLESPYEIEITESTTVRAVTKKGEVYSQIQTVTFEKKVTPEKPVISSNDGLTFTGSTIITITSAPEGENIQIYYTLDGTEPTTGSTLYSVPFEIKETKTVSAIAVWKDVQSEIATNTFTKQSDPEPEPEPEPEPVYYTVTLPEQLTGAILHNGGTHIVREYSSVEFRIELDPNGTGEYPTVYLDNNPWKTYRPDANGTYRIYITTDSEIVIGEVPGYTNYTLTFPQDSVFESDEIFYTGVGIKSDSQTAPFGSTVRLEIDPDTHREFQSWWDGSKQIPYEFLLTEDKTVTAYFRKVSPVSNIDLTQDQIHLFAGRGFISGDVPSRCRVEVVTVSGRLYSTWVGEGAFYIEALPPAVYIVNVYSLAGGTRPYSQKMIVR